MNKRLSSLINELNLDSENTDCKIKTQDIKNRVNDALNTNPYEKEIYMKQKSFKIALIAAAIVILGSTTVFAAINSDFLKTFFAGDTAYLDEFVQTPKQSVTDGKYTLTLEQMLTTKYQALVIYSVEALTDEAKAELNKQDERGNSLFHDIDSLSFAPVDWQSVQNFSGHSQGEITEKRTDNKRYYAISVDDMVNENEEDFYIRLNKMNDPQKIIIPMKSNVETTEIVLAADRPYGQTVLQYTPIGISLEQDGFDKDIYDPYEASKGIYFRMKNDEIKTFNQLLQIRSGERDENDRVKLTALFREIMPLSNIKSVILGNVEYDINDTSKIKAFIPDKTIVPFEMIPYYKEHLWLPIREFCDNVGAEISWNDTTRSATVKYRGSTYVFTDGSPEIKMDSEIINYSDDQNDQTTFIDENGRLIVSGVILDKMLVGTTVTNYIDEENDVRREAKDWIWLVIP